VWGVVSLYPDICLTIWGQGDSTTLTMAVGQRLALRIYFLLPEPYSDEKVAESEPRTPA
jgi:hypothetical protein